MKKLFYLSLACATALVAAEVQIDPIAVESTTLEDVSGEDIKSADVAVALSYKVPSVSLVRRSGVANDIIVRGQKKDNINVLIDDAKIYGACPNRMDPAISHVMTDNIESIEIVEGPYDVENFGTLSGEVKVTTRKPEEGVHGDVNIGVGSFGYQQASGTITGGTERFKLLLSMSGEKSGQYEDGNGDNFAQQVDNYILANPSVAGAAYQDQYKDMDAYTKKTLMGKLYFNITDDQELRLSYTANRSDDILYPSSKMDALYDDSNLYTAEYIIRNIGSLSKELDLQYYYSDVEHPMSTRYRVSAISMGDITSKLTSSIQGAKLKNLTEVSDNIDLTVGLDGSIRNWDGTYYKDGTEMLWPGTSPYPGVVKKSIDDVDTTNMAFFAELDQQISSVNIKYGLRYDDTNIKPSNTDVPPLPEQPDNHYTALSANVFANYAATENLEFFGGVGKASRVPDARELYFKSSMGTVVGTPDLDQTTNYEADLGMKNRYDNFSLKTKLFYSMLKNYIYFQKGLAANNFQNIDGSIYGLEITGSYYALENLYADFGMAYQRGKKAEALPGQTNTNLAEIPPLKGNIALNYVYYQESTATVEFVGANTWTNYDSDNGEQELPSWGIMNLKIDHKLPYGFGIAAGVDNLFNKTYAVSNTYSDLSLLNGGGDVMLMNEPGRYYYLNASYTF